MLKSIRRRGHKLVSLAVEIRISKQIQNMNFKNRKLRKIRTLEFLISGLFRISCFGFPTSDLVTTVNLFPRGSLACTCVIYLAACCWVCGCGRELPEATTSDSTAQPAPSHEPSLAEQIRRVAEGTDNRIDVQEAVITDEDVKPLSGLANLEILVLEHARISDKGLARLRGLSGLLDLRLPRTLVTDEGMRHLAEMPQLERLRFGSPHVTDAGLVHLAGLTNLKSLILVETPVTDAGLEHIWHLRDLESLYLQGTMVTDEGLDRLHAHRAEKGLPRLHVH